MKLFRKRRKLNNKGLSLVELVCAVAIFGLATTAIGGAMVVSAQNYSRGTYELDVQQEAQTTTNLIGDLLYDATGASFDSTATKPILTIKGEKVEYKIEFNKTEHKLEYTESIQNNDGSVTSATGTLAENVTDFSANLDAAGDKFKADKNVEIKLEIEKNGRTYEADYNTTARNGAAESVGVAESAEIIIETPIVLEPGQTYDLPFEVVGSITNKTISIASGTGITAVQSGTNISVTASSTASGTTSFTVSTNEPQKDGDGNPIIGTHLATKTVTVNIRRVNEITSPMDTNNDGIADSNALKSGTSCQKDAEYRIDFAYVGDFMDKVYGKAYDTNYVNPRQLDITYTMTGIGSDPVTKYISSAQVVGLDNPYITFKLAENMPTNSEIIITATAKHPAGTNKTGNSYDTVVDVVKIKNELNLYPDAVFMRGTDGTIVCNSTLLSQIQSIAVSQGADMNNFYHLLTIYELDASGNKVAIPECHQLIVGGGMNFQIDDADSIRLDPRKAYVYKLEIMFYKSKDASGNYTDPIWTTSPYSREYPLDAVSFTYDYHKEENGKKGTITNPYTNMVAESEDTSINIDVKGLEMSSNKDQLAFKVEKLKTDGSWTNADDIEVVDSGRYNIQFRDATKNTGKCTTMFMIRDAGRYRVTAYLNNYSYKEYDGTTSASYTGPFADGSGTFYINVGPKP